MRSLHLLQPGEGKGFLFIIALNPQVVTVQNHLQLWSNTFAKTEDSCSSFAGSDVLQKLAALPAFAHSSPNPSHPLASSQVTKPQNILQPDWKKVSSR